MKIKVITSYKPGTWNEYAKRAVDSVLQHWPADTDVAVYHEGQTQDIFEHPRVQWLDAHEVQPELLNFKNKYQTAFVGQDLCQRKVHSNGTL